MILRKLPMQVEMGIMPGFTSILNLLVILYGALGIYICLVAHRKLTIYFEVRDFAKLLNTSKFDEWVKQCRSVE